MNLNTKNKLQSLQYHLNDFANESCSVGHDINNALAIILGYMDELQSSVDSADFNQERMQFLLKKVNVGVERVQKIGKHLNDARLEKRIAPLACNTREYVHRWFKLLAPFFKNHKIIIAFETDTDDMKFHLERWQINESLNLFFAEYLSEYQFDPAAADTNIRVRYSNNNEGIQLILSHDNSRLQMPKTFLWQQKEHSVQISDNSFVLRLPCQVVV